MQMENFNYWSNLTKICLKKINEWIKKLIEIVPCWELNRSAAARSQVTNAEKISLEFGVLTRDWALMSWIKQLMLLVQLRRPFIVRLAGFLPPKEHEIGSRVGKVGGLGFKRHFPLFSNSQTFFTNYKNVFEQILVAWQLLGHKLLNLAKFDRFRQGPDVAQVAKIHLPLKIWPNRISPGHFDPRSML